MDVNKHKNKPEEKRLDCCISSSVFKDTKCIKPTVGGGALTYI